MKNKVVIIGAGFVGATSAYAIMNRGLASEIVLVDIDEKKAEGEMMDLNHGATFVKPVRISTGDYEDCRDASIVIIAAGANQEPGESRLDLAEKNTAIFKKIVPQIVDYTKDAILLVVTNPVDILTAVTRKISTLPANKVMGSGTVLDTSRFRYLLSLHCKINPKNIHAYVLGEHGDHEVVAWSLTSIAGVPFRDYCVLCGRGHNSRDFMDEISGKVRNSAYEIIEKKGVTYYAVGLAVARIVESIFRDENTILTVSTVLEGQYGLKGLALSLPAIVGHGGAEKILDLKLSEEEEKELVESGEILKGILQGLKI